MAFNAFAGPLLERGRTPLYNSAVHYRAISRDHQGSAAFGISRATANLTQVREPRDFVKLSRDLNVRSALAAHGFDGLYLTLRFGGSRALAAQEDRLLRGNANE
jgi:hypothetical protein